MMSDGRSLWRPRTVLIVFLQAQFLQIIAAQRVDFISFNRTELENNFEYFEHVPGEPLTPKDFQNADQLAAVPTPVGLYDPIELAGLYEGDIVLPNNLKCPNLSCDGQDTKNAILSETQKWPGGVIPYFISAQFNSLERSIIARAFLEYHRQTCISFKPRTNEADYIHIKKGKGCSSHVGRTGGAQPVTLGDGCVYAGITVHELMHATGFWHEQSRWDRDDHVNIHFNNIAPGMAFNFKKYAWTEIQNLSVAYDTSSVMHYGPHAFAKDRRRPTISPKIPNKRMGQREGFSPKDVEKINKLYGCNQEEVEPETTEPISSTTEITDGDECADSHVNCMQWSARGDCKRSLAWMMVNCRRSCELCDVPCDDLNAYCSSWASLGECENNADYMVRYCRKSCGQCTPESVPRKKPVPQPC